MEIKPIAIEDRLNRLRYRSWHRGCKETDIILGGYCDQYMHRMTPEELAIYEELLEEDDADIWAWLTEKSQPQNAIYLPLLEQLRRVRCTL